MSEADPIVCCARINCCHQQVALPPFRLASLKMPNSHAAINFAHLLGPQTMAATIRRLDVILFIRQGECLQLANRTSGRSESELCKLK